MKKVCFPLFLWCGVVWCGVVFSRVYMRDEIRSRFIMDVLDRNIYK